MYLRNNIYTRFDDPEIVDYAINLRGWLEKIPSLNEGSPIKSYVDYLYEKAFPDDDVFEEDEKERTSKSYFQNIRYEPTHLANELESMIPPQHKVRVVNQVVEEMGSWRV